MAIAKTGRRTKISRNDGDFQLLNYPTSQQDGPRKFDPTPGSRRMALQSIDSKWRNWKSKLKCKYYDLEKSIQSQSACPAERVPQTQWVKLLKNWDSAEGRNEMNEKITQVPPDSEDTIAPNNILSQVLGPNKYRRVRMLGGSDHATDVWG
ncbi:hypothetical protein M9H77_02381 [Catharanthus roseus]|uniref:Uncharacterized protein n=1 Tax=Catharanthus roseus TaxID=4058 RepID=A0ACC0C874_CATRO|nr:hypothetical protein M9H77_02381 [Catharanthus roseus]